MENLDSLSYLSIDKSIQAVCNFTMRLPVNSCDDAAREAEPEFEKRRRQMGVMPCLANV